MDWTLLKSKWFGLTSKIPPNFSTMSMKTTDNAPNTSTLPLTIAFDVFSDGWALKQPRQMSSSKTPAVEFRMTDNELKDDLKKLIICNFKSREQNVLGQFGLP